MRRRQHKGFTLIEVIVAIAVVTILAGIITPSVIKHLDDSKRARALNDCQVIAAAIGSFYKDTGRWPNMNATGVTGATGLNLLVGEGSVPTSLNAGTANWIQATTTATADLLSNHLVRNQPKGNTTGPNRYATTGEFRWNGSYQPNFPPDPWGNRYAVNVSNLFGATGGGNGVWVISAGQNGRIDTAFNQAIPATGTLALGQDDIGFRLR